MKRILCVLALLVPFAGVAAGGGEYPLDKAPVDQSDTASLQRGAKLFMNYCSGCHSTQYQRYQRVAEDLQIPAELMQQHLMFVPGAKIGDLMENSMAEKDAAKWFGAPPPDLTLVARVRGADWIYTYLRTFYADPKRPWGVNNLVFKDVGMPHVLQELQGVPSFVDEERMVDGKVESHKVLETDGSGELSPDEYDQAVADLVNFLVYAAEPMQQERKSLGIWVMLFLAVFFVLAYLLKKEYWRDVH